METGSRDSNASPNEQIYVATIERKQSMPAKDMPCLLYTSRVLYGGRMSIAIGFGSALGCAVIGVLAGCYSGYRGGRFDQLMVRISEIFMSIPQLILVLMLVSILGQSAKNIVIIFIICGWGSSFRICLLYTSRCV